MEGPLTLSIEPYYKNEDDFEALNSKEYNIKLQDKDYKLIFEIGKEEINFILEDLNEKDFNYRKKYKQKEIQDKLLLNQEEYPNLKIILNLLDDLYQKNKISIEKNNEGKYSILIKVLRPNGDEITENIKLLLESKSGRDKIELLFNQIQLIKKGDLEKEKDIKILKEELSKKNNIIIEMDKKIESQNKIIDELKKAEDKKINDIETSLFNEINKQNEIINKDINDLNNKITKNIKDLDIFKTQINDKLNKKDEEIRNINEEVIKKLNEKIEKNNNNETIKDIMNNIDVMQKEINKKIKENENNINYKINDLLNNKVDKREISKIYKKINSNYNYIVENIEYINKINYKFKKEPNNLKYKLDITNTNTTVGCNDMFEIFISYKDNNEYLISPNNINFNLDIISLLTNKKISSLKGHNNVIRTIRYFINNKNYNEYLISGDGNKIVIIWDITNNFNIKYQIDTKYGQNIYSCLLIFPHNFDDNYIITSTWHTSDDIDNSSTKIYSLTNGQFIKYINNTNNIAIYYLLLWYNKKDNKYYIIQFSYSKIIINNLLEDELYSELKQEPESDNLSGFIYNKDNKDYLCSSSKNGYINIWDLYKKQFFKNINTANCILAQIIQWNNKFSIVADVDNRSFKIIDLEKFKVIKDIGEQHTDKVKCVKKVYHPIYGESLLSSSKDKTIKLWSF